MAQEVKAELPKAPVPVASAPAAPKKEESQVRAVQTYTSDISRVVEQGGVSTVSIAAAEAERRHKGTEDGVVEVARQPAQDGPSRLRLVLIATSIIFVLSGIIILAAFLIPPAAPQQAAEPQTPFIAVDKTTPIATDGTGARDIVMTELEAAREQVNLSLGLIERLLPATPNAITGLADALPAQKFFELIAPNMPVDLLRTVAPVFLLGVHSFDENQSLLILRVDSYQQAYSGLLAWEHTMPQELAPLFTRRPSLHIPGTAPAPTASTTPQFIQTGFVDRVVENHDARVLENSTGDILLLWTFLDRNTVIITTNEFTLREVLRRLTTAALVPRM